MKENILITGITGFVGSHLADYIIENKFDCNLIGTKRWHLSNLKNIKHILDKINLYDCDYTDPISVRNLIKEIKPLKVFHCAAESFVSPSWLHPNRYMSVNYNSTVNLLDSINELKLKTIFHIPGSGEEYGEIYDDELPILPETVMRPVNPYAVSKIAQDLIGYVYNKSYGLNVIRTRAFNHEGPRREKVFGIPWYAYQIARIEKNFQEPIIKVGRIKDKRNFTHVKDIVKAYWLATEKCTPGELYIVGSEDKKSIFTFEEALKLLISKSTVKNIKYEEDSKYVRPTDVPRLIADTTKFRKATGWEPEISFDTILDETLEYWRKNVNDKND